MKKIVNFFKFENISDDIKRKSFYIFYVVFFLALIVYTGNSRTDKQQEQVKTNISKYEYRYEINNDGVEYILFGTKYNDEMTINKRIQGLEYKYYKCYDNLYIFNEDVYTLYNKNIIDGVDMNLINKQYIDDLMKDSVEISFENNILILNHSEQDLNIEKHYDEDASLQYIILKKDKLNIKYIYYYESISPINIKLN